MDSQVPQLSEQGSDSPIFVLPPYKVERVLVAAAEVIDWGLEMFAIPNLWKQTKGKGIKVAVLDTGIALKHPELVDAVEDARDFTKSPSGPSDIEGHGTHVAGIIAARENRGGVVGVAPEAKLLVGKVLGDNGYGTAQQLVNGIRWAIDKKADIISMSLGSPLPSEEMHAAIKAAVQAGIFVICAAGNSGPNLETVEYPAIYPETIAVGAIDRTRRVAQFSSRGKAVDIVAPGDNILSTYPPRGVAVLSGTSMATPFVSGVVALMLSKHRSFGGQTAVKTQAELIEHLQKTAIDAGMPGFDPYYGFGLINPEALLLSHLDRTLQSLAKEELTTKYIQRLKQLSQDSANSH
ncbi:MAG: S8 family peptidase [Limnoraphis robusta]